MLEENLTVIHDQVILIYHMYLPEQMNVVIIFNDC